MPFRSLLISTAAATSLFMGAATAAEYKLDPAHSFVEFRVQHLGYSWLAGRFNDIDGTFAYAPNQGPEAQSVTVTIDTASIDTNHAERDKHLRSDDFLNVEEYPEARFESTGFEGDESGGKMTGNLTLHGVTKPVTFPVERVGEGEDPWGGYRAGFIGTLEIRRSDFGMDYDLGPSAETVELTLMIEGVRQ